MAGTLYIVGTPIGNLEDVTMRALRVLREVDLIAAEDTRRTARLLQHYSIATPATSLHEHNEHGKTPHLVAKLQAGTSIALVSDAGMPLVSDPGATLVRAAREAGIPIQVVPGPSAVTAALAGAGISGPFAFLGFPPSSGKAREDWFVEIGQTTSSMPAVFFESPHRIDRTMRELAELLGNRPIIVARELTKLHEHLVEQPIIDWLAGQRTPQSSKGEHVIIVTPGENAETLPPERPDDRVISTEMGQMTENEGMRPKEAAKILAKKYGMAASDVYALHTKRDP
ncbi:MAG TPA: 16S rRNA (cytidine(1402)-2'-O)-methyltransferase [Vicinamibacterales bacterium]|nr:16S rRNA (cytidine(1402)-2'-O)-methyltransferase [Vicinamibacterales bacterium]